MQFFRPYNKFSSLIIISFLFQFFTPAAFGIFTVKECLDTRFETNVEHPVAPMGLFKRVLNISKDRCNIYITHEMYKFKKQGWTIDVCRGPVHIKKGTSSIEVIKRTSACSNSSEETPSNFCKEWNTISQIIQDDGLIFAPGEKEVLSDPHGQLKCVHLLLMSYFDQGIIYGRHSVQEGTYFENFSASASFLEEQEKLLHEKKVKQEHALNLHEESQFHSEEERQPPIEQTEQDPKKTSQSHEDQTTTL